MKVEVKELKISNELAKKIDMICRFAGVSSNLTSGCVKNIKGTNIAYVKPHLLSVNGNDYLLFEECDDVFINGYSKRIKLKDLCMYLKFNLKLGVQNKAYFEVKSMELLYF